MMVLFNGLLLRRDPESAGYSPWGEKNEPTLPSKEDVKIPAKGVTLSMVLKDITFWFIGLSYFSIAYCIYGITTFMVDYAKYQIGVPLEKASLLATVHGVAQVVGVLIILPLSDYLGRKKTIMISNAVITASLAGILFLGKSWSVLWPFVGILAFFCGAIFPVYGACAGDYFPRNVMGTVIGAWTLFYGVGAVLVHWVTGILRDTTGNYDQPFMINIAMAALGVFFMALVKRQALPRNGK
jgi:sugar phosphate permease